VVHELVVSWSTKAKAGIVQGFYISALYRFLYQF
jgi:hypothetical protein